MRDGLRLRMTLLRRGDRFGFGSFVWDGGEFRFRVFLIEVLKAAQVALAGGIDAVVGVGGLEVDVSVVHGLGDDMQVVLNGLAAAGIEQIELGAGVGGMGAGKLPDVAADVLVAEVHALHGRGVAADSVFLDGRANAEHCFEFFHDG